MSALLTYLGTAFSVPVVAQLVGQLLHHLQTLDRPPTVEECWGGASLSRLAAFEARRALTRTTLEEEVCAHLHRCSSYRGAELRMDGCTLGHPNAWPRHALPMDRWLWRVVGSFPLQGEHINLLEMQSILAALRWRTTRVEGLRLRICHFADSQICLAVLIKGRSSSHA